MNPWPFVIGAYALTLGGTAAMAAAAWIAMRRAEAQADRQRKK
jgi:formate-dependent nitrite reductase membrane component NrfD